MKHVMTQEIQLSGLIGTARRPDKQKIRINGNFWWKNGLHLLSEEGKMIYRHGCFRLYNYFRINKILNRNFLRLLDRALS